MKNQMSKDEMRELAQFLEQEADGAEPIDGVIFDSVRLQSLTRRVTKTKRNPITKAALKELSKNPQLVNFRPFITDKEEEAFKEEFGPYAKALRDDDEREYFRKRKEQLLGNDKYELDPDVDYNLVLMIIMDEIILHRLLQRLAEKPNEKVTNSQITDVQKRLSKNLRLLDVTREQRNQRGEADALDSLAAAVIALQRNKRERLKQLEEYEKEEKELLKKIAQKTPPEIEYFDTEYDEEELEDGQLPNG